jgi:hypothetical protein
MGQLFDLGVEWPNLVTYQQFSRFLTLLEILLAIVPGDFTDFEGTDRGRFFEQSWCLKALGYDF